MSGGSNNYLYQAVEVDDLAGNKTEILNMGERLIALGYAEEGGKTLKILKLFKEADTLAKDLASIWKSVERLDSSDCGIEEVTQAVCVFRRENR